MFLIPLVSVAGVAQLVERNLAKVEVVGSNPIARSKPPLFINCLQVKIGIYSLFAILILKLGFRC